MKKYIVPGLCALALVLASATPASSATRRSHRAMPPKDRVSADSARAAALEKVPGGHVKSHELEREGGRWIYSYDISVPGKPGVEEVHVDAKSGEVLSQKHESAATERRETAKERAMKRKAAAAPNAAISPTTADTTHH